MKNGETADVKNTDAKTFSLLKSILFIVFGLVFLVVGGKIVVDSAVFLATALNISEKVIGLTIVAIGTSLPELVTSIAAVLKKSDDIAIGNIIGSNIFNIFLILGASATVCPMEYSPIFNRDIYFLFFGTTLLILAMFTGKRRMLDRWESAVLLLLYVGYVVYLIMQNE
jgi:cation:H+ antiporter